MFMVFYVAVMASNYWLFGLSNGWAHLPPGPVRLENMAARILAHHAVHTRADCEASPPTEGPSPFGKISREAHPEGAKLEVQRRGRRTGRLAPRAGSLGPNGVAPVLGAL
jgi:hypothetical protein